MKLLKKGKIEPRREIDKGNPYSLLGIKRKATKKEIKKAFKREARRWHPDTGADDPAIFILLWQAKQTLLDKNTRALFDDFGIFDSNSRAGSLKMRHRATSDLQHLILRIIKSHPAVDTIDIKQEMEDKLDEAAEAVEEELRQYKAEIFRFESALRRIGGNNELAQAMKAPVENAIKDVKKARKEKKLMLMTIEECKVILPGFKYNFDEDPVMKYVGNLCISYGG